VLRNWTSKIIPKPLCMIKRRCLFFLIFFLLSSRLVKAQDTYPLNDIKNPKEDCYAFINATIVKDVHTTIQDAALVIRKGKIESVGRQITLPNDAVIVDCKGKYIYPSFIDMYTDYGTEPVKEGRRGIRGQSQMLSGTKGAYGWNQAIKSENEVSKTFAVNDSRIELRRGFNVDLYFNISPAFR
jgi:hypothetical protein